MLPSSCQILEILAIAVPEFPGRSRFSVFKCSLPGLLGKLAVFSGDRLGNLRHSRPCLDL